MLQRCDTDNGIPYKTVPAQSSQHLTLSRSCAQTVRACCGAWPQLGSGAFYSLCVRVLPHMTLLSAFAQTSYFGGGIEGVLLTQGGGYGITAGFGFSLSHSCLT